MHQMNLVGGPDFMAFELSTPPRSGSTETVGFNYPQSGAQGDPDCCGRFK
jgi:hypothetical protein